MKIIEQQNNNKPAFTLIELLVVIAIIGILTALAVVSLQNSRRSARDAKRLADVKQLQIALELYYQDNSNYPSTLLPGDTLATNSITYMETIPYPPTTIDGDCSTSSYIYSTSNDYTYYNIHFCLSSNIGALPAGEVVASPRGLGVWTCGERLLDERDNQSYATVQIGSQCWMAENINYDRNCASTTWVTNIDTGWCGCYNNSSTLCDIYGKLYQWSAAMDGSIIEGAQGICPDGWHIATSGEWTILFDYVNTPSLNYRCNGINTYIAKSLASVSDWALNDTICSVGNNQQTNNASGFNALPAGYRDLNGYFVNRSSNADFWTSSVNGELAYFRLIMRSSIIPSSVSDKKFYSVSVRCLKNN